MLRIYNRWGEIVFESYDIKQGWDGMYNKEKAKEGTYNWEISYNESRCYNKRLHFYGHVNLIR
jgi:gliding motility-associated-like protein